MELELQQLQEQLEETPALKPVRFFADDCSSEALTSLMASNNWGILGESLRKEVSFDYHGRTVFQQIQH